MFEVSAHSRPRAIIFGTRAVLKVTISESSSLNMSTWAIDFTPPQSGTHTHLSIICQHQPVDQKHDASSLLRPFSCPRLFRRLQSKIPALCLTTFPNLPQAPLAILLHKPVSPQLTLCSDRTDFIPFMIFTTHLVISSSELSIPKYRYGFYSYLAVFIELYYYYSQDF